MKTLASTSQRALVRARDLARIPSLDSEAADGIIEGSFSESTSAITITSTIEINSSAIGSGRGDGL